ncbi:hypothetical protein [Paenibacillus sp. KN14-4R]|uniref:hypothetical protein n=1 Tax=Paenibacillus sp. KN14-4R TaxID=3445773 RepID=UPI003FA16567
MSTLKNRKILAILVTVFLIVLISTWYIGSQQNNNKQTPDGVINNFMKALVDKDAKTATSLMFLDCSKSLDEKINGLEEELSKNPISSYRIILTKQLEDDTVQYMIGLNENTELEYRVFKVEGVWMLSYERLGENPNKLLTKNCKE